MDACLRILFDKSARVLASFVPPLRQLWDASSARCEMTLRGHGSTVMCLHYDPATHRLVSGGVDKTVRAWDVRTGRLVQTYASVHGGAVFAVHQLGDHIVTGSSDGKVCVLNFSAGR